MVDVLGEAINESDFKFEIGESVLQEMISGYFTENIFEELIQNDYDAESPSTLIRFMNDKLVVEGFGDPIDDNGWKRLGKILGTGRDTPPKESKLGIKNMGLRALFLIGDYIRIKSAGRRAILSLNLGTTNPINDPTFTREKGVNIEVPYRKEPYKVFSVFDAEKERQLCRRISETLPFLLIKLPLDSKKKILQSVQIIFDRLGVTLECKVALRKLKSRRGRTGLMYRRTVEFVRTCTNQQESEGFEPIKKIFREFEFIEKIEVSSMYKEERIPEYFSPHKTEKGLRLNVGISIPIDSRGKIDQSVLGRFFYPIGLDKVFTGNYFSVNAPFNLNDTRDRLNDNDFNRELIQQTAKTASKILKIELLPLLGSEAYDVLLENDQKNELFIETLFKEIKTGTLILNNKFVHNRLHKGMFLGEKKYLPCSSDGTKVALDLYGFISDSDLISSMINPKVANIFLNHKIVELFTIQDVVDLMVNDEEAIRSNKISTWQFTSESSYRKEFKNIDKQKKYLDAIANHIEELKAKDKEFHKKLRASKSLLNANGDLSKWNLFVFDGVESNFRGFNKSSIVHPALKDLNLFKRHRILSKYNISKEIIERYIPLIQEGTQEKEKRRFLRFILDNIDFLKEKNCVSKLKALPIFPDKNNELCTFDEIYLLDEELKKAFGETLCYPAPVLLENPIFMKVFKIKSRITEADIIRRAKDINPANPKIKQKDSILFEKFLSKRKISNNLLIQLKQIFHTLDSNNLLVPIGKAYENSKLIMDIVGSKEVHYVKGPYTLLYRRLGVNTKPKFFDQMRFLRNIRDKQKPMQHYQEFYINLARAIKEEKIKSTEYSEEKIISVEGKYCIPRKVLVNPTRRVKDDFGEFRTYFNGCSKALKDALINLGCIEKPDNKDYKEILIMIAEKCQEMSPDDFRRHYRKRIHALYERRDWKDVEFEDKDEVILTDLGSMVPVSFAKEGKVVIDDNNTISEQLKENGIYLADIGSLEGEAFLRNMSLKRTSEIFEPVTVHIIGESDSTGKDDMRLVRKLKGDKFAKHVRAILLTQFKHKSQFERSGWDAKLGKISGIKVCKDIISTYIINGIEVIGHEEVYLKDGNIYIVEQLRGEKLQKLSYLISKEILGTIDENRSLSSWIMNLLEVTDPENFLKGWGIKNIKAKTYREPKSAIQKSRTGLIDPKNITPNIHKGRKHGGGRGGGGGGGGSRPPQNHASNYGEICEWVRTNANGFCQSCILICEECRKSRNIEICDCELSEQVHGPSDIHHFEKFENNPERDKKGNLILLCKYHHNILDRVGNFKLGFRNEGIIIEENEDVVLLTLYPEVMSEEELRLRFTKEHFNYVKNYMLR